MELESGRPRVLIADARDARRQTLCSLLAPVCEIETAVDARAALDAASARPPDLMIVDPALPSPEGLVLLPALREQETTREVPVILLTTRAGARPYAGVLIAGFDDRLAERDLSRELLSRVQPRLELVRLRRELEQRERQAALELESANRAREEFLARLGHELRNPLGSITNAAWLLAAPEVSPELAGRAREVLVRQAAQLARVSDELLDMARLSFGKSRQPALVTESNGESTGVAPPAVEGDRAAPATTDAGTASRRVLLVEDHDDAREMMSAVLIGGGHRVIDAADGFIALERARATGPDVALIDIGMPRMDGYALARRLREDPATRHMPLVAVTGYGQPEDAARAREAGFATHLVKPVEPARLLEIVARAQRIETQAAPAV